MKKNPGMITTLLVLLVLLITLPSCAVEKKSALTAAAPPAQQPPPSVSNDIAKVAIKSGVLACAPRIDQITNFLTAGSQGVGALLFIPPDNQDQRLVSVSMEIPTTAQMLAAYASTSVAPNQANGCGGMYESVLYWNQTCDIVAVHNFGGLKVIGPLAKTITVLDGGTWIKIFLMPAGSGCVSIKKEVIQ